MSFVHVRDVVCEESAVYDMETEERFKKKLQSTYYGNLSRGGGG